MKQGALQCRKWGATCQVCSEPVLEALNLSISLRMVESGSEVFDPSLLYKGSEVSRDELGPVVGGDGIGHA